jgi:RNA polymerase sigma-70 factor (ECF subfamily)
LEQIMTSNSSFVELIHQVRGGDPEAAEKLARQYEPAIRRALRLRLDPRLRRSCDSMDICQAVLCSFFFRAAAGEYEVETPEQLVKLLVTMARNKLSKAHRAEFRAKRDVRRMTAASAEECNPSDGASTPSQQVAARELLSEVRRRLSPEELALLEQRSLGLDWAAIASRMGGSAVALRKKLSRALARVAAELGLDEEIS